MINEIDNSSNHKIYNLFKNQIISGDVDIIFQKYIKGGLSDELRRHRDPVLIKI